jgi:hypothetical protein
VWRTKDFSEFRRIARIRYIDGFLSQGKATLKNVPSQSFWLFNSSAADAAADDDDDGAVSIMLFD